MSAIDHIFTTLAIGSAAMAVHEAGHVTMALMLKVRVKGFLICWRGIAIVREQGSYLENLLVTSAGPIINLAFALWFWHSLPMFALANLVFGVVNSLPITGSDGNRIIDCIKEMKRVNQ